MSMIPLTIRALLMGGWLSILTAACGVAETGFPVSWNTAALMDTPKVHPAKEFQSDGLTAIYIEGLPYQGRPTQFAAFYGLPPEAALRKVPGVVLVHGGRGSAYPDWVRLWNSRGYAAIAFDHAATLPIGVSTTYPWPTNPQGGPIMKNGGNVNDPIPDQWMYHAVANTILANSFLRSLPQVDPDRIGLTGISWGGVLCDVVPALDKRFKFAAAVYGTGNISHDYDDGTCYVRPNGPQQERELWRKQWDPTNYLDRISIPMLWITGPNDFAFTLRALRISANQFKAPLTVSILPEFAHGQKAGAAPEEIRVFADSIVLDGRPLVQITAQGREGEAAWCTFLTERAPKAAELHYTTDSGRWQKRKWQSQPAKIDPGASRVTAALPAGVTSFFLNIIDDRGLVTTTVPWTPEP